MNRIVALLSLVVLFASAAFAGPLSDSYAHNGLFANASMGVGYASFENSEEKEILRADGFGVRLHGKLGHYVFRDLALHANLGYVMYSNFREVHEGLPVYLDHDFYVVSSVFLGAGATYYVPGWNNVYFSGAFGMTGYRLNCRKHSGNTGLKAFSFDVEVGKDWWVGEHTAIGVSLAYNSGEYWSDDDGVFRSSSVMLLFSVTLN